MIQARRWLTDPYRWLDERSARDGLTFRARLPTHGTPLITGDPELIHEIVRSPDLDSGKGISALREVFGSDSLITLDGEAHAARRGVVAPGFRPPRVDRHDELTLEVARDTLRSLPHGGTFSAYEVMRRISLRVIVRAVFGADGADARTAESLTAAFLDSFSSPLVLFVRALHVPVGPWRRAMRNRDRLRRFVHERIRAFRSLGGTDGGRDHGILGELLRGSPALADEDVTAEVIALLLFGHDTGAATLAWALAHLSERPPVLARIRAEAVEVEGRHGRLVPEEHRLLRSCLLESMRLCPVVVHLTRVARRATVVGGHRMAEGDRVLPSAYLAQRNADVFSEPRRFDAERFLRRPPPRLSYFPFGFGSRTCVGEPFVRRQMILVASTVARTLDLAPAAGYRVRPVRHLVLVIPEGGGRLVAMQR